MIRGFTTGLAILLLALPGHLRTEQARRAGPPYSPEDALATFRIVPGFQIELLAGDPLVTSPVAMEVDEHGRLFVVEMPGYPLDVGGSGRVVVLRDTNGDGTPDRRVVFADGLRLPTGVMRWKQGVIVTDSPQVWYLEDTDGDMRADVKREMLTGFALSNPQHTTNTPLYGLDNWIYLANEGPVRTTRYRDVFGDTGSPVRFPDRPHSPRLAPDADGRNVRFRPDSGELEMLSARSQFGQTFDAWGRHFLVTNNRHIYQEVIAARYLSRNPSLVVPSVVEQLPDYPLPAALYPITQNPEFQLLTDVGVMTSASGLTWYLASLFPQEYQSAVFVAEGAHNLVHVATVRDRGATFRASRMFDGREFLASTDAWFRPVNFYVGPDGALYVIDYYRKILEHPEWMDEATAKSQDVYAGQDRGRIYRITPAGAPKSSWLDRVSLGKASDTDLVRSLADPNIWWRRHAQRLLVDRRPPDVGAALANLAGSGESAFGRVHALWTSHALAALPEDTLTRALRDPIPGVRENAIRIVELRLPSTPSLASSLLPLADDPDAKVRFQLLLTLGGVDTTTARTLRTKMLFDHVEDEWMQIAGLSAASLEQVSLLRAATTRLARSDTAATRTLFRRLGALGAAASSPLVLREILRTVERTSHAADDWWRGATLEGIASGVRSDRRRAAALDPERRIVTGMLFEPATPAVRHGALAVIEALGLPSGQAATRVEQRAKLVAADSSADATARADAIRLLALAGVDRNEPVFSAVLTSPNPAPVQIAAVRALAAPSGTRSAASFIDWWEGWTPGVRAEAVRAMVREPGRVRVLLDALDAKRIRISEIEWPLRVRMMMVDDEALRARARSMLRQPGDASGESIDRLRPASTMAGDVQRGRDVFARTCASCHQYRGAHGSRFGPDLGEVRGRLPLDLLTDIIQPNRSIADGYELWNVELTDGSTVSGAIGGETPTSVTFLLPGGNESTIARARIRTMRIAPISAMPEGLGDALDLQAMADLIAFIKGGS
jgi:putative membrane-bound dehydrogenase-like protein